MKVVYSEYQLNLKVKLFYSDPAGATKCWNFPLEVKLDAQVFFFIFNPKLENQTSLTCKVKFDCDSAKSLVTR